MQLTRRILIVCADGCFREDLGERLIRADNFDAFEAEDGESGIERALGDRPDLVLLSADLPDMDGPEVCRRMRAEGIGCPIMILANPAEDVEVIAGLEAGANDYVSRPFSFRVLLARIRSHLRQHEELGEAALPLGPYSFLPGKRIVLDCSRRQIRLTEKEARIIRRLIDSSGRTVSRDSLLETIWDRGGDMSTHTLETHIYRIRQKLEPDRNRPSILLTEPGGYRIRTHIAMA